MELDRIYSGESVAFTIDLDTSDSNADYALSGVVEYRIGLAGGAELLAATATYDATTGVVTVAFDPVPVLPDGVYPWQLVADGGQLLAEGTIPIGALIGSAAPAIVPTVGTNSYLDVADADALLAFTLSADAWRQASADDRARALVTATRAIDSMMLVGSRVDDEQHLAFPRFIPCRPNSRRNVVGMSVEYETGGVSGVTQTSVPGEVLLACALEAAERLAIGDTTDRMRLQAQGVVSVSSPARSESFGGRRRPLMSASAQQHMRPYTVGTAAVR